MKLQLTAGVYLEFEDGALLAHTLNDKMQCRLDTPVIDVLKRLHEPVAMDQLLERFAPDQQESVGKVLTSLLEAGFLEEVRDEGAVRRGHEPWWEAWGTAARSFHFASRDADFVKFRSDRARELTQELADSRPNPPIAKNYLDRPQLPLPRVLDPLDVPFKQVLERRRTHRDFQDVTVSLDAFATVMHYTFGPLRYQDTGLLGTQMVKASPAGGSRHDVECYVACFNVADVPPGLYHYNTQTHALSRLRAFTRERTMELLDDQTYCGSCGFICFLTSVVERVTHKYRHPRAYRTWMYNVGHAAQTFVLVATALGLGPFQTAAFADTELEAELGISPAEEFCTYVVGAGIPHLTDSGLPLDFRPPRVPTL